MYFKYVPYNAKSFTDGQGISNSLENFRGIFTLVNFLRVCLIVLGYMINSNHLLSLVGRLHSKSCKHAMFNLNAIASVAVTCKT